MRCTVALAKARIPVGRSDYVSLPKQRSSLSRSIDFGTLLTEDETDTYPKSAIMDYVVHAT